MIKLIVCLLLVFFTTSSNAVFAGIIGSKHDFKGNVKVANNQERCKVCHVPHNSSANFPSYLIASGIEYSGQNIVFYGGSSGKPTNSSSICLSCHNGTITTSLGTGSTDFTKSHPFSVVYPTNTSYKSSSGGQIMGSDGTLRLEGPDKNRVECGTCHNPHNPGASGNFLAIENTNSNLCLTCHQK